MDMLQRLRMANIFGQDQPIGMPDFGSRSFDPMQAFRETLRARNAQDMQSFNESQPRPTGVGQYDPVTGVDRIRQVGESMISSPSRPMNYTVGASATSNANPIDVFESGGMTPYQKAQLDLSKEKVGQAGEIASTKANISQQNVDIAKQKANILDFKAKNPGLKVLAPKGGNFTFYNPADGKMIDSGIETGSMSEQDKLDLTQENALEQIGTRGEESRKTLAQSGEQNLSAIAARIAGQKEVQAAKPVTATQEKARVENAINEIIVKNPGIEKFIIRDDKGNITVSPDATPEVKMLVSGIYKKPETKPVSKPVTKPTETKKPTDPLGLRK